MRSALQTRARRPLILLFVVLCHCLIFVALLRNVGSPPDRRRLADDPLVLLRLSQSPANAKSPPRFHLSEAAPRVAAAHASVPKPLAPSLPPAIPPAATPHSAPRVIDWEREAALELQRGNADVERDRAYRNLAGLTPERRAWLESHHMEPVPPEGIHWAHPRVEIVNGLPLIWVNNHCVAVPLMMLLVFCSIGHIEPRGDLLDHMREADEARARSLVPR